MNPLNMFQFHDLWKLSLFQYHNNIINIAYLHFSHGQDCSFSYCLGQNICPTSEIKGLYKRESKMLECPVSPPFSTEVMLGIWTMSCVVTTNWRTKNSSTEILKWKMQNWLVIYVIYQVNRNIISERQRAMNSKKKANVNSLYITENQEHKKTGWLKNYQVVFR